MMPPFQRPALELAEIVRRHGNRLAHLSGEAQRILLAIVSCRTAALGGHVETCDHCHYQRIAYNSCRNRHCPRCQGSACAKWMSDRESELLPVEYFHVVFTLPDTFNSLALSNKRIVYNVLFDAVAQTLLEVAANPKHLGARIGFLAILHTWGQNLCLHPHLHCIVPGGGLSPDGRWINCKPGFFLPVRVLSRVFRGKFIDSLKRAQGQGKLIGAENDDAFNQLLDASVKHDWVVYAKPPFGGPEQVLKYLSRYTHRIAISNRRLISTDSQSVTFKWKDYAHHNKPRTMTLDGAEFLRRFLMHAVPRGFMRIRHFGLLANRVRHSNLALCRQLFNASPPTVRAVEPADPCTCPPMPPWPIDRRPQPLTAATANADAAAGFIVMPDADCFILAFKAAVPTTGVFPCAALEDHHPQTDLIGRSSSAPACHRRQQPANHQPTPRNGAGQNQDQAIQSP